MAVARFESVEFALFGSRAFVAQFLERFHAFRVSAPCHPKRGDAPIEMRLLHVFLWRELMGRPPPDPFSKQRVSAL
jgi:hypothetical protein